MYKYQIWAWTYINSEYKEWKITVYRKKKLTDKQKDRQAQSPHATKSSGLHKNLKHQTPRLLFATENNIQTVPIFSSAFSI